MKVSSINNNYQNTNFNGTVSKSVYKYLNEARYDALNKPLSFFRDSNGKISTTMEYGEVKTLIEGIMTKLNNFMAKTHKKTYLFLSEMSDKRHIRITNPELETCIMGGFDWPKDSINNDEILSTAPKLKGVFDSCSHTYSELKSFDEFTTHLVEKINPEEIDGALFDKKVIEVVKKAEDTAPKNRFENRLAFNQLDRLAPKFHRQSIYTEQFHIIQSLAYKMQEERAKNPIEQSKEELKNLKIK
jgi:hypothetical protein